MWKQQLIQAAVEASANAYCPYSKYKVGAALLVKGTQEKPVIVKGANYENASYPCGSCAEKSAIGAAIVQGHREFEAVAVATANGGSPCGQCRQALNEFGPTMLLILCDYQGKVIIETTLDKILPHAFGPKSLD